MIVVGGPGTFWDHMIRNHQMASFITTAQGLAQMRSPFRPTNTDQDRSLVSSISGVGIMTIASKIPALGSLLKIARWRGRWWLHTGWARIIATFSNASSFRWNLLPLPMPQKALFTLTLRSIPTCDVKWRISAAG